MKPRISAFALMGVLTAYSLFTPPLKHVAAQSDPRGMRVQATSQAERRVALVIGNSAYKDSPLLNPVNDARAMAHALRNLGFEVLYGENLSQNDMKRNIRAFGVKIRNGGVGLFYYAGHGIQIRGINYLVPVGATINNEEEVEYESVDVGLVLAQMESAGNQLNIVILDACRNNPFARSFRSAQKGLASIDAPSGTLLAYATAPGSVASDGTQGNGLYTKQLLKHMQMPGLSLEQVFKQVRIEVRRETEDKQTPWESSSLEGEFYFSAAATSGRSVASTTNAVDATQIELSFWETIKNSANPEEFKAYLQQYPNGRFASIARLRSQNNLAAPAAGMASTTVPVPAVTESTASSSAAVTHFQKGNNYLIQQKHAEAESEYREAVRLDPNQASYRGWLGVALSNQRKDALAEPELRQAIKLDPKEAWYHYTLAVSLGYLLRPFEQEAAYREAIRLDPIRKAYRFWLGVLLNTWQRYGEAEAEFREAIRINPDPFRYNPGGITDPSDSQCRYNLGLSLANQRRFADAETELRQALTMEPNQASYHGALGGVFYSQSRFVESEAEYRQAMRLNPYDASFHGWLGAALGNQQKLAEAEAELRQATRLDPNQAWYHASLGYAMLSQRRFSEAETEYREAIRLNPNDASYYGGLGNVFFNQGWLGNVLVNQQKIAEAEAAYRKSISLDPNQAWVHSSLGYALELLNKKADAVAEYLRALQLNPNDQVAQQGLKRVQRR